MPELYIPVTTIWFSLALQLALLLIVVSVDRYIRSEKKAVLLTVIVLEASLVIQGGLHDIFESGSIVHARLAVSIYGYCARPVVLMLFCCIVDMGRRHRAGWLLVGINAAVHMTAPFSAICFTITPDNNFFRGPLGYTCHFISMLLLLYLLWLSFSEFRSFKKDSVIPIANALGVAAAILLDSFSHYKYMKSPAPFLLIAIVTCSAFYYIWLHLQFVGEHEHALMAEQRIRTMVSQMQPHFIYNSLTVIGAYLDEPDKAEEALGHFTKFLRGSIDLLDTAECIPAEKELETVDNYLYLAKMRFGEKLMVVRAIEHTDFYLPAFTIQALVENAVTHGIRKSAGGKGTLTLKSYETNAAHIVEVQDDGAGFDTGILKRDEKNPFDETAHIGLRNVKERLAVMAKGTLEIQSARGSGTLVRVILPKANTHTKRADLL